jgi:hypothetical protein
MLESLILNGALLFGGAACLVWVLRALMLRFLPDSLAGPGGLLIDPEGRLGLFQMWHDHDRQGWADRPDGDGGCDQAHSAASARVARAASTSARSLRTSSSSDWKST